MLNSTVSSLTLNACTVSIRLEINVSFELLLLTLEFSIQFHEPGRIKETQQINKSLMSLKDCIRNRALSAINPGKIQKMLYSHFTYFNTLSGEMGEENKENFVPFQVSVGSSNKCS